MDLLRHLRPDVLSIQELTRGWSGSWTGRG